MPTSRPSTRRRRTALVAAGAVTVAGSLLSSPAPAGAQTAPFGTYPAGTQSGAGAMPGVLVAGDSLTVQAAGAPGGLAGPLSQATGRASMVSAALGASWKTYYDADQTAGNWTLPAYAYVFRPSVTVTALGSNDAKLLATGTPLYTDTIIRDTAITGLRDQMQWSRCALLVNTYTDSKDPGFPSSTTTLINLGLFGVAVQINVELKANRVFIADWNAVAKANRAAYYPPLDANGNGNIHFSAAGAVAYRDFIVAKTKEVLARPQCA